MCTGRHGNKQTQQSIIVTYLQKNLHRNIKHRESPLTPSPCRKERDTWRESKIKLQLLQLIRNSIPLDDRIITDQHTAPSGSDQQMKDFMISKVCWEDIWSLIREDIDPTTLEHTASDHGRELYRCHVAIVWN